MINKIVQFIKENFEKYQKEDDEDLANIVLNHIRHNTFDILMRKDEIRAVCRFNVINDGRVADILDLIISKEEKDGKKIIKYFIARGWMKFPSLVFLRFERGLKKRSEYRMYRIIKFLKGGKK